MQKYLIRENQKKENWENANEQNERKYGRDEKYPQLNLNDITNTVITMQSISAQLKNRTFSI